MESILAVISVVAFLAAITAWSFAWKISRDWAEYTKRLIRKTERMNADWADFYRMICEKEKERVRVGHKENPAVGGEKV